MNAPVDVMAVLKAVHQSIEFDYGVGSVPELTESRAAVAELIEAAGAVAMSSVMFPHSPSESCVATDAIRSLDTALARLSPPLTREQQAQGDETAARA